MIFKVQSILLDVKLNTRYAVSKRDDNKRRDKMETKTKRIEELEKECEELREWVDILQETIDDMYDYMYTIESDYGDDD